jgi:uncharacterized membrane protein YedE/YeeE
MSSVKVHLAYGFLGTTMGVVLSAIGFPDYDQLHNMFTFQDTRMLYGFALAVVIASVFFVALHFIRHIPFEKKVYHPGTVPGSIIFGYGWAICGACPSIAFIQVGQGKLAAIATLIGIYAGVKAYRAFHARYFKWDTGTCGI